MTAETVPCPTCVAAETRATAAERERDGERGVLAMTVARLGGIVESGPTARHNFLQRIDALRDIERELDEAKASRERFIADFLQATKDRDEAKRKLAAAEQAAATLRTLYETLARKEHARLAWDHRDGAALGNAHVSGDMEACGHPDCRAACAALKGERP